MTRRLCALILLLFGCSAASHAAPLRVVVTGDSIANGVAPRLPAAYNRAGLEVTSLKVAVGGTTSGRYVGRDIDPSVGYAHSFIDDALALNPDVVILHLGVNNALQRQADEFASDLAFILDTYASHGVDVIVGGLLPVLPHPTNANYARADQEVREYYNPLLAAEAAARGLVFVENYYAIQENADWLDWYSDNGTSPGYVHLWGGGAGPPGYVWLADQYAQAVLSLTLPEPSSYAMALSALAGLALFARRMRR